MNKEIHIKSLSIGYQGKEILNNINLVSDKNKMIAIFGRNGQGKSTLLKTISCSIPQITGEIIYNEKDILKLPIKERSKLLSIVSTSKVDVGGINVKDFIGFGRFPYTNWLGLNKEKDFFEINKAIKLCKLENLAFRNYDEISDGEKQKVHIARAIAQNTEIIVLDEPTVHLDLINKVEILKLLKELVKNHNKTIIFATHQIEYALQICDNIWLINDGKIESLTPKEIINNNKLKELFNEDIINFDKPSISFKLKLF